MVKLCPFMSYPIAGPDAPQLIRVPCEGNACMAWFPGWKDRPNSGYCQLIIHPSGVE